MAVIGAPLAITNVLGLIMTDANTTTPSGHLVYVIQTTKHGPIKVGLTSNLKKRIAQIQTGCPNPVTLVAWYPRSSRRKAAALEKELHNLLDGHRMQGEWFGVSAIDKLLRSNNGIVLNGSAPLDGLKPIKECGFQASQDKLLNRKMKWASAALRKKTKNLYYSMFGPRHGKYSFYLTQRPREMMIKSDMRRDGLAAANPQSKKSLLKFYAAVLIPDRWHSAMISEDGNAVVAWKYGDQFLIAEFREDFMIKSSFNILETSQHDRVLEHQTIAIFQKIISDAARLEKQAAA